jgi:hypothetical protein
VEQDPPPRSGRDEDEDEPSSPEHELRGDERLYTGEPVETDTGLRRPRQMNVGGDNMEGGGEWPDPDAPAVPGAIGWDVPAATPPPGYTESESHSRVTADHDEIRSWVESHGGRPVRARPSGAPEEPGVPQIDFLHGRGDRSLEPVDWDEWFLLFDANDLAVLFRDGEDDDWDYASVEFVRRR